MKNFRTISTLLLAAAAFACEKTAVQDITGPVAASRIRFFNFGVNAPPVNFYAGDTKVTAVTSATGVESVNGVAYGAVGSGGFYSALDPGTYDFKARISATVDKDRVVATVNSTLADGKNYSLFMSGFYNTTTKLVDGFVVEDSYVEAIDYTQAYVRFVNAIANSQPMTLYARNTTTTTESAVGAAVAYKSAGTFTALPSGIYDLGTRLAGATANAITRTAVTFVAGRVYTIGARGDMTIVSTTAVNRPFLDNTANR